MNKGISDISRTKVLAFCLFLFSVVVWSRPVFSQTPLSTTVVVSGLSSPLYVTAPPGDTQRIFIVQQAGRIRIFKNGSLLPGNFLNLQGKITSGGERGLLGLAFHPDYANNGYFYVNYTDSSGNTVIARFQVTTNPDSADFSTRQILLTVTQPFSNHNGGWLDFGPNDGYLYIALGDGGNGGDPQDNGQDTLSLLGKILRIDVDTTQGYKIPPSNPFVDSVGVLKEIWALGLRNPWRNSFDRLTGDLYIADVGQGSWEEISFQPAANIGGENYGWRFKEGDHCFNPSTGCDTIMGLTDPIHEYPHSDGCSVTGGYVYRGSAIPDLQGTYFFGDYCTRSIWSFRYDGNDTTEFKDRSSELSVNGNISSFGEDGSGELYITGHSNGTVYKIVRLCLYLAGDANGSGGISLPDVVFLVNFIFKAGPQPNPTCTGDVNGNATVNLADVVHLVNFVYKSGSAPVKTGLCCL